MKERYMIKAAAYLCLFREQDGKKQILLSRRQNTGYMDDKYDMVVSGHVEDGESLKETLVREAREEAGIEILENDLEFLMLFDESSAGYYKVFFRAKHYSGEPRIMEPEKCAEHLWADIDNLPADIIPHLSAVIKNIELGITYDDDNFSNQKQYLARMAAWNTIRLRKNGAGFYLIERNWHSGEC